MIKDWRHDELWGLLLGLCLTAAIISVVWVFDLPGMSDEGSASIPLPAAMETLVQIQDSLTPS